MKKKKKDQVSTNEERLAIKYWNEVAKHMTDWNLAKEGKVRAAQLRKQYIHAHGLILQILGIVGADLIQSHPDDWENRISKISEIDWSRDNATLWEGRALVGGRVSKAHNNVILTSNVVKNILNLPLSDAEKKVETLFAKGSDK